MPARYPEEFRRRAMRLVHEGLWVIQVARELGIAESGLRRWLKQHDVDSGAADGPTSEERAELTSLRRKTGCCAWSVNLLSSRGFLRLRLRAELVITRCLEGWSKR